MTKFMELYDIAASITNKYDELYTLTSRKIISTDSSDYNNLIEEAKILVLKESSILSNLKIEELNELLEDLRKILNKYFDVSVEDDISSVEGLELFLKKLSNCPNRNNYKIDIDVLLRVFDRLKSQIFILCGDIIRVKLKINGAQVTTYDVSLWDSIISFLNMQTLKQVKNKINGLVPGSKSDTKFIEELKYNLECSKFTYFYETFMAEIFALYAFNDIDKINLPDIEKLKKVPVFDEDLYNEFLLNEAKMIACELASLDYLENNPECIFYFLKLVTSFEVLKTN